jgi:hypothetical protein
MSANTKTHTIRLRINQSAKEIWPTFLPGPECADGDNIQEAIDRDSGNRELTKNYLIQFSSSEVLEDTWTHENQAYPAPFIQAERDGRLPQGFSYAVGAQQGLTAYLTTRFSDAIAILTRRAIEASFEYKNKKLTFAHESYSPDALCLFDSDNMPKDPITLRVKDTFVINFNDRLKPQGNIEISSIITISHPKSAETREAKEAEFQAHFLRICLSNPYFLYSDLNPERPYQSKTIKKGMFSQIQVSNIPKRPHEDMELMKFIFKLGYFFSTTADEKEKFTQTMIKAWHEPQTYFPALYAKAVHFTSRLSAKQREPAKTELHRLYSAALTTNQSVFPSNALALAKTQKIKRAVKIFAFFLGLSAVAVTAVFFPPLIAALAGASLLILTGATQAIDSKIQLRQRPNPALVLGAPPSNLRPPERVESVAEFT